MNTSHYSFSARLKGLGTRQVKIGCAIMDMGNFFSSKDNMEVPQTEAQRVDDTPVRGAISGSILTKPLACPIGVDTSKAGMEGLDKDRIDQIITQASMGSKFYKNELRKEKQLADRIEQMKKDLEAVTPAQQLAFRTAADSEIASLERTRDLGHVIVHIDMDAFYAAVEMRDNSSLRDVPMAVGSMGMLVSAGSMGMLVMHLSLLRETPLPWGEVGIRWGFDA